MLKFCKKLQITLVITVILCYYIDMTSEVINRKRRFIMNIALMAHDSKKELMTQFCIAYCGILSRHSLCATVIEIPLPMPLSLICSPSHMISAVPAVKQRMMTMAWKTIAKPV